MDFLTCTDMFNPSGWIHQSYSIIPVLLAVRGAGHVNSQDMWGFFQINVCCLVHWQQSQRRCAGYTEKGECYQEQHGQTFRQVGSFGQPLITY